MTNLSQRRPHRRLSSIKSELRQALDNVPPEIFEIIKDFTLSCDVAADPYCIKEGSVVVDGTYKTPSILQLNHQIRQRELPRYYATTTFVIHDQSEQGKCSRLTRWLSSLAKEIVITIPRVRVVSHEVNLQRTDMITSVGIYTQTPSGFEVISIHERNCGRIIWEWERSFPGWALRRHDRMLGFTM